ncbi:peptide/nickel transport system permease protein [Frankia sp. EI5c]|uniref:ABC transporter permease n=1 Tax=Frankia sp. EI5c TaxID=683316 RepID=UPI0007C3DBC5|nr:ABC transporter permease [Frankia sp. EI5c]OAA27499.1 peptide/nickel transport system permease protein [Frankia sp. EI5c]
MSLAENPVRGGTPRWSWPWSRSRSRSWVPGVRALGPGVVLAGLFLLVVTLAAAFPTLFTDTDPLEIDPSQALTGPSGAHPFGTDQSGRDVFARIVHGARDSLAVAYAATVMSLVLSTVLGLLAGLGGRVVDAVISRLIEVLFSFPSFLFALLILTIFDKSLVVTTVAVGIALTPGLARLVRAQVLVVRDSGYVESARVLGHSPARVIARTVAPNALQPLVAFAFLNVGGALIWSTTLSYFGFGAVPPAPDWGAMLSDAQSYILQIWWLPVFTGLVVILTAVSATVVGRHLQFALSGRGRR